MSVDEGQINPACFCSAYMILSIYLKLCRLGAALSYKWNPDVRLLSMEASLGSTFLSELMCCDTGPKLINEKINVAQNCV